MMILRLLLLLSLLLPLGAAEVEAFLRVQRRGRSTDCLQVAIKTYTVAEEKKIQMVGVSHIGTAGYYAGLQEILDASDVVLYEGVDGDLSAFREASELQAPERSGLQVNLARALGLVFQLHHIDYTREHFINSDLTSRQLLALFEGKEMPESSPAARAQMEELLAGMEQASATGQVAAAALEFLEMRPGWSRAMRWAMVNMLGAVSGNVAEYPGLPEHMRTLMTVLIDKRNEKVMHDLHEQLEKLPAGGTVAVFYGAAHLQDFDNRLREELEPLATETLWKTAFCGNLQTSGLNLVEKKMITLFVRQQVTALRMISTPVKEETESEDRED